MPKKTREENYPNSTCLTSTDVTEANLTQESTPNETSSDFITTIGAEDATNPVSSEAASRDINMITAEILSCKKQAVKSCIRIGELLIEAKELLKHGEWREWLTNNVAFSERTAQRHMRIAKELANTTSMSDLGCSKAYTLLTLSPKERNDFISTLHEVNGMLMNAEEMTSRELADKIRDITQKNKVPMPNLTKPRTFDSSNENASVAEFDEADESDPHYAALNTNLNEIMRLIDDMLDDLSSLRDNTILYDDFSTALRATCYKACRHIDALKEVDRNKDFDDGEDIDNVA